MEVKGSIQAEPSWASTSEPSSSNPWFPAKSWVRAFKSSTTAHLYIGAIPFIVPWENGLIVPGIGTVLLNWAFCANDIKV